MNAFSKFTTVTSAFALMVVSGCAASLPGVEHPSSDTHPSVRSSAPATVPPQQCAPCGTPTGPTKHYTNLP
jgi:hypothetical protein